MQELGGKYVVKADGLMGGKGVKVLFLSKVDGCVPQTQHVNLRMVRRRQGLPPQPVCVPPVRNNLLIFPLTRPQSRPEMGVL